jgi:protein-disulfide isomerase
MSRSLVGAAMVLLIACACDKGAKSSSPGAVSVVAEDSKTVLARYGNGKTITVGDLEKSPGYDKLFELEQQRYEARRSAVDQLIFQDLIEAEAKKQGAKDGESWLKTQIDAKIKQPSDAEIQAMFDQAKDRMPPGATLEQVRPQIVQFLTRQQQSKLVQEMYEPIEKAANIQMSIVEPKKPKKEVEAKGPSRGPDNAKVTIVEFSDFQCPFCGRAHDTVEEVMSAYAGKVRLVFRQFPLEFHENAPKAAEAALCANEQSKFWDYHDVLFKNQQKLKVEDLKAHAASMGLDAAKFNECLDSGRMAAVVKEDQAAGSKVGVNGTPAFFINGTMLSGAQPLEEFKKVIDAELATN